MSSIALEAYLAKLYTDANSRESFFADPDRAARVAGLAEADIAALWQIDRAGLQMAADSYAQKRAQHRRAKKNVFESLRDWLRNR